MLPIGLNMCSPADHELINLAKFRYSLVQKPGSSPAIMFLCVPSVCRMRNVYLQCISSPDDLFSASLCKACTVVNITNLLVCCWLTERHRWRGERVPAEQPTSSGKGTVTVELSSCRSVKVIFLSCSVSLSLYLSVSLRWRIPPCVGRWLCIRWWQERRMTLMLQRKWLKECRRLQPCFTTSRWWVTAPFTDPVTDHDGAEWSVKLSFCLSVRRSIHSNPKRWFGTNCCPNRDAALWWPASGWLHCTTCPGQTSDRWWSMCKNCWSIKQV